MRMYRMAVMVLALLALPLTAHAQVGTISAARARQIALRSVPNNQGVKSEELKRKDGVLVYEFDIETPGRGHTEVRVDAHTGAVLTNKHEENIAQTAARKTENAAHKVGNAVDKTADKVFNKDEVRTANVRISEMHARRIALRHAGGGTVKDIDLKREHGVVLWEVKVDSPNKTEHKVRIDANTGAILNDKHEH